MSGERQIRQSKAIYCAFASYGRRARTKSALFLAVATLALAATAISFSFAEDNSARILLPIEVLGEDGTTATSTIDLPGAAVHQAQLLWLQLHGVRYPDQASVRINDGEWLPLNNNTASVAEPGKSFGGIGGGFSTLTMTLPIKTGTLLEGKNTIHFRFNHTDGISSGFRVLAWNLLTSENKKILPPEDFAEDSPENWTSPLSDANSIQAGKVLWNSATLNASGLPNSPKIQAHCADCHAHDGRDLKYFNFSNNSIESRSRFHGMSKLEGEQVASYIRNLQVPNPGRPWNPPYQPGPGLDEQPAANWAAGAGLKWVLERDADALPYLLHKSGEPLPNVPLDNSAQLTPQITASLFRPDDNLNPREIPIALQLPDWSGWLPHVHPKDAWGAEFTGSEFAALYDGEAASKNKSSLRALLASSPANKNNPQAVAAAFARWSEARQNFVKRIAKPDGQWTPELANKLYSTQLWQLVKTWEMTQELGLESSAYGGTAANSRMWLNTVPAETSPQAVHIPDGAAGVGGSALTNEYVSASWYELQILLNSGSHQRRDRGPVDWVYVVGRFHDLYYQTHQPEPTRLLVAIIKAQQSTDSRIGPDDLRRGWRPEDNIDPRIMTSSVWSPAFEPLPPEVRRALTESFLAAWMDKNQQYPIARYLPFGLTRKPYVVTGGYGDITGGQAWKAAKEFSDAGVTPDLVQRLRQWGASYDERAKRLQYDQTASRKN
jgi:hypothetical protein